MADTVHANIYIQGQFKNEMEIPVNITAVSLIQSLNTIYHLNIAPKDIFNKYLKMDYPKALMRGDRTLKEYGIRDCSEIYMEDRDF